jgi:hypothetical protein
MGLFKAFFQIFKHEALIVEINACPHTGHSYLVRHNGILNLSDPQNFFAIFLEEFGKAKIIFLLIKTSVPCLALEVWISQPAHEGVGAHHLLRAHPRRELSIPVPKLTTRGAAVATSRNHPYFFTLSAQRVV